VLQTAAAAPRLRNGLLQTNKLCGKQTLEISFKEYFFFMNNFYFTDFLNKIYFFIFYFLNNIYLFLQIF